MPFGMCENIQSVKIHGTLYVGGGDSKFVVKKDFEVATYDIEAGKWAILPPYRASQFAMAVINNHLVLVGGSDWPYRKHCKMLGVWEADSAKWTHPYPDMTVPRYSCSAFVYKQWLVVAGGLGEFHRMSSVKL